MTYLFIDTNVLLTFFSFSTDDLEELRKLRVAINAGQINLLVPRQVRDELARNREAQVAQSLNALRELNSKQRLPGMALNLAEAKAFHSARETYGKALNALIDKLVDQAAQASLEADRVLKELLDAGTQIEVTPDIVTAAQRRSALGNPPGKRGSLGDAVNWEAMLRHCPNASDLVLVTGDGDYVSPLNSGTASGFLRNEWAKRVGGEVTLHRRISDFLGERFPKIKLANELEKELRVQRLVQSGSFAETHAAIAQLQPYPDLTRQQAADLVTAASDNNQIRWILEDDDVRGFYEQLLRGAGTGLADEDRTKLEALLRPPA